MQLEFAQVLTGEVLVHAFVSVSDEAGEDGVHPLASGDDSALLAFAHHVDDGMRDRLNEIRSQPSALRSDRPEESRCHSYCLLSAELLDRPLLLT